MLELAKGGFTRLGENVRDRSAGPFLYLSVSVNEVEGQRLCQQVANCCLAGAHKTCENDITALVVHFARIAYTVCR